jgi:hypothetical protein
LEVNEVEKKTGPAGTFGDLLRDRPSIGAGYGDPSGATTIACAEAHFQRVLADVPGDHVHRRRKRLNAMRNLKWASEFQDILPILTEREDLRARVLGLIEQPILGKVVEGGDRANRLRKILAALVRGELTLWDTFTATESLLPRRDSPHAGSNKVFADGWGERLVRTHLSLAYNQAVLEMLFEAGEKFCFVPHSSEEHADSPCSRVLAGKVHEVEILHGRLVESYRRGNWSKLPKVPDHPHCTHVVRPVEKTTADHGGQELGLPEPLTTSG